ncbi:hypothetical protein C8Q78DRAFT_448551 [Trametes maxima]|nr:hypothetical protein C8Q78DRAFT_448551 [Trametes maxima]
MRTVASGDEPAAHPTRAVAVPQRREPSKKVVLRLVEAAAKAKITTPIAQKAQKRRRTTLVLHPVSGSRSVCRWDGCGADLGDGRDVWAHMKAAHSSGRSGSAKKAEPEKKPEEHDTAMVAGDAQAEADMDVDEPQNEEIIGADPESEDEVDFHDLDSKGDLPSVAPQEREKGVPVGCWAEKVRCLWHGCASEMQYPALRRHVESKHVPLRGASCPKGCGYKINRADMLKRHAEKCRYVATLALRKGEPRSKDER